MVLAAPGHHARGDAVGGLEVARCNLKLKVKQRAVLHLDAGGNFGAG